ncbi:ABC transporter permease [Bifidobacterium callimiconis]|uniref:ABC transporter substrate-binding protein n=1 Tax=Bifidobacterium callimiconis TaxID=2306973 RepID=A0A430FC49_9BIFI|nr:ABC transporter permease [Bifidobacterium callimiconis]RSX50378.1 ABC transporter substrate-binding protein [Bifidobacterium callimiconis]
MLHMIIDDLQIAPLRSFLTSLSMLIGIVALISSVLIGSVGKDYLQVINARISGWEPTYTIAIEDADIDDLDTNARFYERLESYDQGVFAAEYVYNGMSLQDTNGQWHHVEANVTTSYLSSVIFKPLMQGSWLSDTDQYATTEVVLNKAAADMLSKADSASDSKVDETTAVMALDEHVQTFASVINGIVDDGSSEPEVYINAFSFQRLVPQLWEPDGLRILFHPITENEDAGETEIQAKSALKDILADTIGGSASWNRSDNADSYKSVIDLLQKTTLATALLLLLVSAIGLINIGLSNIEQRSRELLIRRALGATRSSIALLVLGSSIILGSIITAVAIGISFLAVPLIPTLLPNGSLIGVPRYPTNAAFLACIASLVTSTLGSLAPAIKAACLQPALILR